MQRHLVGDTVEQYVIGALDPESVRFVEAHVAQCEPCARLLREEAQLEVTLYRLAEGGVGQQRPSRKTVGALVASVVALAAGVALVVVLRTEPETTARPAVRRCDDVACISKAQFDGVITLDGDGQPIVPRYDEPGGAP